MAFRRGAARLARQSRCLVAATRSNPRSVLPAASPAQDAVLGVVKLSLVPSRSFAAAAEPAPAPSASKGYIQTVLTSLQGAQNGW